MSEYIASPVLLTLKEAIQFVRYSRSTIYRWMSKKLLVPVRIADGVKLFFYRRDLERLRRQ